jgi:hypothetical protein
MLPELVTPAYWVRRPPQRLAVKGLTGETRVEFLARRLLVEWYTMAELAAQASCTRPYAWVVVQQLARDRIVFRRHRTTPGAYRAFEYRVFAEAVRVRLR